MNEDVYRLLSKHHVGKMFFIESRKYRLSLFFPLYSSAVYGDKLKKIDCEMEINLVH